MENENGSKISKIFGLFVIVIIGVILVVYIAFGLISIEIGYQNDMSSKSRRANVQTFVKNIRSQKEEKNLDIVVGEIISMDNNIVIVETELEKGTTLNVQLLLGKDDLSIVKIGEEISATLVSEVPVSKAGDGVLEVSNVVISMKN